MFGGLLAGRHVGVTGLMGWFETLPLPITTAILASLSALVALACASIRWPWLKWLLALGSPFAIAWCTYWAPVWMGESAAEYSAWSRRFLIAWGVPGALVSALVLYVAGRSKQRVLPTGPEPE